MLPTSDSDTHSECARLQPHWAANFAPYYYLCEDDRMIGLALIVLLQAGQWTSIPPLAIARQEVGVAAAEGRVYVIGGIGTDQRGSRVVEIFDTRTGQWRSGPSLPIP